MAIDTKTLQDCLWKIVSFSMQICYKFVSENPVFSSVSLFFILLYMFSPTFFAFVVYSLLILISAFGFYRVFLYNDNKSTEIAESYKKNDGDPSNMGTNGSISDHVKNKNPEKYTQSSSIVDKSVNIERNGKDIKEVKVDSVTGECSPCKANERGLSQFNVGCDEGLRIRSRRKGSSETSEDSREDRHEAVRWNDDEQKYVKDPGDSDVERNKRLESMIARRKARKLFSFQVRHTLMSAGNNDPVEHLASILVPRTNNLISNNSNDPASPGSAPSVLIPMHNPFDIPYETHEERPDLTDESFQQEFLAGNRDLMLCRHSSFSWGALFSLDSIVDQDEMVTNNISFKPRAPQKLKNPVLKLETHLEDDDVGEVIEEESCQEKEAISDGCSAEDHATHEGQAAQQAPDSLDIHHKEDEIDPQTKDIVAESSGVGSSSSSSSEEDLSTCRPNKAEILRSLTFGRNAVLPRDDDDQVNDFTHNSDQTILNNIKTDDGFFYNARVMHDHARTNSLASDMLVEVSEISSPRSIPSLDEEYSENEELKEASSHPSQVATSHESNWREVPEISDQQDISGVSRTNPNAEADTSDAEKVSEEDSINSDNSLAPSRTGLRDSTQIHSTDSNIEELPDSSETNKIGNITINNLSDSETPMKENVEKSNTTDKMDNGTPKQTIQPKDLPESSGGSESNSVDHQQNEEREHSRDYNGESEEQPSQNDLTDNPTSVQRNHSLGSPENRRNEEVVPEFEFPVSSAENEASGMVSEIETEQGPNILSSGSSPKSVLQPRFSSDLVSSMDPNQGTSTEYQQHHNQIVDDDSVLPVVNLNHSASQNTSPRQGDSTSEPSHVIETLQSPRFADALICVPFLSRLEEHQNHDASITTPASSSSQDIHDPYPHQSNFNQEADTSDHIDNSVVNDNQAITNLESAENIDGDNPNGSSTNQETELSDSSGNLVAQVDKKEPLDPPLERTMEEGNNSTANQNDSVINKPDNSELKSVKEDNGNLSEHVIRAEDVHNSSELDATLDSKSTSDVEGGLNNNSEVKITGDDHE